MGTKHFHTLGSMATFPCPVSVPVRPSTVPNVPVSPVSEHLRRVTSPHSWEHSWVYLMSTVLSVKMARGSLRVSGTLIKQPLSTVLAILNGANSGIIRILECFTNRLGFSGEMLSHKHMWCSLDSMARYSGMLNGCICVRLRSLVDSL